ncbi:MAG: hypothetical protein WA172_13355 [Terriglobales bacterium]
MLKHKSHLDALAETVVALQAQHDGSAWNEIALIATLKELLPGYKSSTAFHRLRSATQKAASLSSTDQQELEEAVKALKRKPQLRSWLS